MPSDGPTPFANITYLDLALGSSNLIWRLKLRRDIICESLILTRILLRKRGSSAHYLPGVTAHSH